MHRFIAPDGTDYYRAVYAIDGAPFVALTNGVTSAIVALTRRRIQWAASGGRRVIACGRYEIPNREVVPARLRGASTVIRLMSTAAKTQACSHHTRRTRWLRPIPESDADFERLISVRENCEALFADLRLRMGRPCGIDETRLRMLVQQIGSIERAARNGR